MEYDTEIGYILLSYTKLSYNKLPIIINMITGIVYVCIYTWTDL